MSIFRKSVKLDERWGSAEDGKHGREDLVLKINNFKQTNKT